MICFASLFVFCLIGDIMDKKKSILNVTISVGFKIITIIMTLLVKRLLIKYCGNDINGLNALYLSIIGMLSVAELGVGSAITFCMYKPIVNGENDKVSALYMLFRKLYLIIGGVFLVGGLGITPFISFFAKDYTEIDVNLYLTFVIMLVSVVLTYLFSSKTSLINAYKNNYITTAITSGGLVLQNVLQIAVLIVTRSFIWYLICRVIAALVQWGITELIVRKKYPHIISNKQKVDETTKKSLIKSIKAMFMHKVGYLLVNTVDSIVISAFIGVVALGEYSNYSTIMISLTSVLSLIFSSLTSVLGHLYVEENKKTTKNYCEVMHLINFLIGTVFFLGYYAVIDNLIAILFSPELMVDKTVSFVITLNGFVQFMRQSTLAFRDATGTFYNDRWKPLFEGLTNLVLSILFVNFIGVCGVIVATIITNLLICHVVEPYVLYKNAFEMSPKSYYLRNYVMIFAFTGALFLLHFCLFTKENQWTELLLNGSISVGISVLMCLIALLSNMKLSKQLMKGLKRRRAK